MSFIVKAIYQHGVFMPIESVTGLPENETVELQVMPVVPTPVDDAPALDWWAASEAEWAQLSVWEQHGLHDPNVTPEEIKMRIQCVNETRAAIPLADDDALEIATADWLAEENLRLE